MGGLKNKVYNSLPTVIKDLLISTDGWLVGSAVGNIKEDKDNTDYDVIVPNGESLMIAMRLFRANYIQLNSWGGFKITVGNIKIDLWVEELSHFIHTASRFTYAYSVKGSKLIGTCED